MSAENTEFGGTFYIVEACDLCQEVLAEYPADRPAFYRLPPDQCPDCRGRSDIPRKLGPNEHAERAERLERAVDQFLKRIDATLCCGVCEPGGPGEHRKNCPVPELENALEGGF